MAYPRDVDGPFPSERIKEVFRYTMITTFFTFIVLGAVQFLDVSGRYNATITGTMIGHPSGTPGSSGQYFYTDFFDTEQEAMEVIKERCRDLINAEKVDITFEVKEV
jgi:hypothetical protein